MSIRSNAPDCHNAPQHFVDFLNTKIKVYDGTAQDLWALIQQILTRTEYTLFTERFGYHDFAGLAKAIVQDQQEQDDILAAASAILAKPIVRTHTFERGPKIKESAKDFLERFQECCESCFGDRGLNFHVANAKYNSMLLNCLRPLLSQQLRQITWTVSTLIPINFIVPLRLCGNIRTKRRCRPA
ncbi:hypothetical protein chiPu_0002550 [Chiloscyllium punctatum]|uniref:Uncharacterized protein n=1 Tax=Chiloscyllium punctatum TaxID=137246 RepID=A0A401S1C5_CHIPU|nr:hypothetical protein [Chiloscyllium punctatum]